MQYKVVTVSKPSSCCTDRLAPLDSEISDTCNELAARGFVLVSAYDTKQPSGGVCCSNCMFGPQTPCWKKASCLVFAKP